MCTVACKGITHGPAGKSPRCCYNLARGLLFSFLFLLFVSPTHGRRLTSFHIIPLSFMAHSPPPCFLSLSSFLSSLVLCTLRILRIAMYSATHACSTHADCCSLTPMYRTATVLPHTQAASSCTSSIYSGSDRETCSLT